MRTASRILSAALFVGAAVCVPSAPAASAAPPPSTASQPADPCRDFLALISRPPVPLSPEIKPTASTDSLTEFHFTFTSEPGQIVTGILIKPTASAVPGARHAVVISLHGTGGRKEDERSFLQNCAARGFIGVAIDGRYHGERAASAPKTANLNAYQSAILRAWNDSAPAPAPSPAASPSTAPAAHPEHPLFYDTVWDVMRLIDYLDTRDDVDPDRIGILGISKGGIEAYLAAAVDPRIAAAIPCISVESFQWALDHNMWQHRVETFQGAFNIAAKNAGRSNQDPAFVKMFYDRLMPGVTGEFDGPSITTLIAPRPLMLINGADDPRTPPESLKLCTDALQAAYSAQMAGDHLQILIQPNTAHQVRPASRAAAIDFFAKWLKPEKLAAQAASAAAENSAAHPSKNSDLAPAISPEALTALLTAAAEKNHVTIDSKDIREHAPISLHAAASGNIFRFILALETGGDALEADELHLKADAAGQEALTGTITFSARSATGEKSTSTLMGCMRDVTAAFPATANTIWATSFTRQKDPAAWQITGQCTDPKHADSVLKAIQADTHFKNSEIKTTPGPDGLFTFTLAFEYHD